MPKIILAMDPSVGDSVNKEEAIMNWKDNTENLYESFEYTRHKELAVTVTEGEAKGDWVLKLGLSYNKIQSWKCPCDTYGSMLFTGSKTGKL